MNRRQAKIEALRLAGWAVQSELDNGMGGHYDDDDAVVKVQSEIRYIAWRLLRRADDLALTRKSLEGDG